MPVHRLDNARWGFVSNCFVCEPANAGGLQIAFIHDDEDQTVSARFSLGDRFSGTPRYLHGGVALAVLDEAMAWGAIALAGVFALTRSTEARFVRPVVLDAPHRVEARLVDRAAPVDGNGDLAMAAVITDEDGATCVEASARFTPMSAASAGGAIGILGGDDTRYVRG